MLCKLFRKLSNTWVDNDHSSCPIHVAKARLFFFFFASSTHQVHFFFQLIHILLILLSLLLLTVPAVRGRRQFVIIFPFLVWRERVRQNTLFSRKNRDCALGNVAWLPWNFPFCRAKGQFLKLWFSNNNSNNNKKRCTTNVKLLMDPETPKTVQKTHSAHRADFETKVQTTGSPQLSCLINNLWHKVEDWALNSHMRKKKREL